MSARELTELEACVGGTVLMTSFTSTTKNRNVAEIFAGNGEERPNVASVIFEIIIDEYDQVYERSPFGDISAFSLKPFEEEVLLCPGTVLQVKSVETKGQVTWVVGRMCQPEENELLRQVLIARRKYFNEDSDESQSDSFNYLWMVLHLSGDVRQKKQFMKFRQSLLKSSTDPVSAFWEECASLGTEYNELDLTDADYDWRHQTILGKLQKAARSALDSRPVEDRQRDPLIMFISRMEDILHMSESDQNSIDVSEFVALLIKAMERDCEKWIQPVLDLMQSRHVKPFLEIRRLKNQSVGTRMDNTLGIFQDEIIPEKALERITWCWRLGYDAYKKGDYEQVIKRSREGLTISSCSADAHVQFYTLLNMSYHAQGNWIAVIECCQSYINMPQLPPNSPFIVRAYITCGEAYAQLEDYGAAFLNYTKALELQHQHHPPRHPLTAEVYVELGILFHTVGDAATAMEHFQTAIALDFPESASEAHQWMSIIYKKMKQYHKARSHILQHLEIRQRHFPSETVELVEAHLDLIRIEHITGNHQQRDLYLQQALRFAAFSEEARRLLHKKIQDILDMPTRTTQ